MIELAGGAESRSEEGRDEAELAWEGPATDTAGPGRGEEGAGQTEQPIR